MDRASSSKAVRDSDLCKKRQRQEAATGSRGHLQRHDLQLRLGRPCPHYPKGPMPCQKGGGDQVDLLFTLEITALILRAIRWMVEEFFRIMEKNVIIPIRAPRGTSYPDHNI
uniref:Uncharacterized protein n=1 Tax=Cannabis sativa TaxID=3483 RepID=A0A803NJM3_CANSA